MEEVEACKQEVKTTNETKATNEIFDREQEINEKTHDKFLGQIISSDATDARNISDRAARGKGMSNKIMFRDFAITMIFRNAYIISTKLARSEAWYDVSKKCI